MARKLTAGVVLRHPGSGAPVFMALGSDLPDWAEGLVGDHVLTGGPKSESNDNPAEPAEARSDSDPPPVVGSGSSRVKWATYARANRVEVTDDMSRDDIVDACRVTGVRVQ